MTSKEMDRALEFILQQQERTSVHLEKLAGYQIRERELVIQMRHSSGTTHGVWTAPKSKIEARRRIVLTCNGVTNSS